jgi:hypothetical protein
MPYISTIVDFEIGEVYDELSSYERKQLIEWLHKDGHLSEYVRDYNEQADRSNQLTDESFVTDCISLGEAFYRMSDDDVQVMRDMAAKYKHH